MPKRITTQEFIERSIKIHGNKYDYSNVDYIGAHKMVKIICKEHGEFLQIPNNHLHNRGCPKCVGKNKTTDEFIEQCIAKHGNKYDYTSTNYISAKKKVIIICKKHGEFLQTPDSHLRGSGCPKCGNLNTASALKISYEEFLVRCIAKHGNKYDYSKATYIKSNGKVIIICKKHGEFLQEANSHCLGNGCPKCSNLYRPTTEEFIDECKLKHGDKYDYSKVNYINAIEKTIIICKKHGKFLQTPSNHLNGQGCPKCGIISCALLNTKSSDQFIKKSKEIHGDKYDYSKAIYNGAKKKVIIICPKHGEFLQRANDHLSNCGCPTCNSSKGELKIINFIENNKITIEKQKSFPTCINPLTKRKLRFDFYIPDKNILIEYDGVQHFNEGIRKPIFGKHLFTEKDYLSNKHRDRVKTKWAKDSNIKLIRIPYTKYDKIDEILTKELL